MDQNRIIAGMKAQLVEMSRRQRNMMRSGRVVEVDAAKHRVRVDIGDEESPLHSAWIPWPERAGNRKTWNPPSVGEIMTVMSPSGEIDGRSWAVHGGFSPDNEAPSVDGDDAVFAVGNVRISARDGGATVSVGGVSLAISDAGVTITGGRVTHNGKNIGDTHVHPQNSGNHFGGGTDTAPPNP